MALNKQFSKFTGKEKKPYKHESFSQSGEDLIVDFIFKTIGISDPSYIDIGAHHPFRFNNTAIFYERGCRGINIEPDPALFDNFKYYRPDDINLNIGVGASASKLILNVMSTPAMNTFSLDEAKRLEANYGFTIQKQIEITIETVTNVLEKYHEKKFPDFLSLDVEGMDEIILKSICFQNGPIVICTETLSFEKDGTGIKNKEIVEFLLSKNYMLYADTYINTIFVKNESWKKNKV